MKKNRTLLEVIIAVSIIVLVLRYQYAKKPVVSRQPIKIPGEAVKSMHKK